MPLRSTNPTKGSRQERSVSCLERSGETQGAPDVGGNWGLGVRARNLWNGCWWVRLRFCSLRCDGLYRLGRHEGDDPNLLVRGHPQS